MSLECVDEYVCRVGLGVCVIKVPAKVYMNYVSNGARRDQVSPRA